MQKESANRNLGREKKSFKVNLGQFVATLKQRWLRGKTFPVLLRREAGFRRSVRVRRRLVKDG